MSLGHVIASWLRARPTRLPRLPLFCRPLLPQPRFLPSPHREMEQRVTDYLTKQVQIDHNVVRRLATPSHIQAQMFAVALP